MKILKIIYDFQESWRYFKWTVSAPAEQFQFKIKLLKPVWNERGMVEITFPQLYPQSYVTIIISF